MPQILQQLPIVLLVATNLTIPSTADFHPAQAETCVAATSCRQQPVQFVTGQRITVEVANLTSSIIKLQQVDRTDPRTSSLSRWEYQPPSNRHHQRTSCKSKN